MPVVTPCFPVRRSWFWTGTIRFHGAFQVEGGCSATAIGSGWALMLYEGIILWGPRSRSRTKMSDTSELYVRFHNYGNGRILNHVPG